MIDIDKMTLREMNDYFHFQMKVNDIPYILHRHISEEKIRKRFGTNNERSIPVRDLVTYLEENKEDVDIERLMLINLDAYTFLKEIKDDPNNKARNSLGKYGFTEEGIEEGWKKAREVVAQICKDKDVEFAKQEHLNGIYSSKVLSSRELLRGHSSEEERKRERATKRGIKILSSAALLNALLETNRIDVNHEIFKVPDLGNTILETIVYNSCSRMRMHPQTIKDMIEKGEFDNFLTNHLRRLDGREIQKAFSGVEQYVDVEKMSLYTLSSIIEKIENADLIYYTSQKGKIDVLSYAPFVTANAQLVPYFEGYLKEYDSVISETDTEVTIGDKTYTTAEAKTAMKKYIHGRYMARFSMEEQIKVFLERGVEDTGVHKNQLQYIKRYIVEERGVRNLKELNQMLDIHLLGDKEVLKLYADRKLSLENIKDMRERLCLENQITPDFIVSQIDGLYNGKEENKQYAEGTIKRYVDLYKELYIQGKSEEEIIEEAKRLLSKLENSKKENKGRTTEGQQADLLKFGVISEKTYAKLMDRGDISTDNFMYQYEHGQIHIDTIRELKEEGMTFGNLDIEEYIINSYMKIREQEHPDLEELDKFIRLYKELTLKNMSEEERIDAANEFIIRIGERIENDVRQEHAKKTFGSDDRRKLYEAGVIPIDTIAFWADKGELTSLLNSEVLIPKDIRRLYQDRRIILQDIQEMIESKDIRLEQKIGLINMVFPSPEDAIIRNQLFEKITDLDITVDFRDDNTIHREMKQEKSKAQYDKHLFDTAVRYNAWIESDENVKMEILNDGHIAAHLPNVKGGIVCIEQFYRLKKAKQGKKSIEDAYGVKGYVLTKDAYEKNKDRFITPDNRVIRSELAKIVKALEPELEEKGIKGELYHFENYPEVVQELIGIPINLAKAKTEEQGEKTIRELKESQQYTSEEIEKMIKINKAWEQVRKSRGIYEK